MSSKRRGTSCFVPADILLPRTAELEKWAVIACDQFTSQPEYWRRVRAFVGDAPSALKLILPEAELDGGYERRIPEIHEQMRRYLDGGLFAQYREAFVYVERSLCDGTLRRGLVGAVDLERYDYGSDAQTPVRATERTVVERIPPRKKIREHAALELPHVLLLCDDEQERIIEPMTAEKESLPLLYDFTLMEQGGRIAGYLVQGEAAQRVLRSLEEYEKSAAQRDRAPGGEAVLYGVGDGNHSLATAKACWEELRQGLSAEERESHPARFALVELENLRDPCQQIEPIHRIVKHTDAPALLRAAQREIGAAQGVPIPWYSGAESGTLPLDTEDGELPVSVLQSFLDGYLAAHPGEIDYIHGEEALRTLAGDEDAVGFLLPAIGKDELFRGIAAGGVLPRKTFSMGQALDKRYYLEARELL